MSIPTTCGRVLFRSIATLLLCGVVACNSEFDPASLIASPRVLGAKIEVGGDPARSQPLPGETAEMTWLAVSNDPEQTWMWLLSACSSVTSVTGDSFCLQAPFATSLQGAPTQAPPSITLNVPATEQALAGSLEVWVTGIICTDGIPTQNGELLECDGGTHPGTTVTFTLDLVLDPAVANLNPSMDDWAFQLDGETWDASTPTSTTGCAGTTGPSLPAVTAGTLETTVTFQSTTEDHETYPVGTTATEEELLLVSHFSTAGEFERQFTDIARNETAEVTWVPPIQASVDGDTTRYFFVVRDQRGGLAWTQRTTCTVQP